MRKVHYLLAGLVFRAFLYGEVEVDLLFLGLALGENLIGRFAFVLEFEPLAEKDFVDLVGFFDKRADLGEKCALVRNLHGAG